MIELLGDSLSHQARTDASTDFTVPSAAAPITNHSDRATTSVQMIIGILVVLTG
jgi:hypothetical protein